MTGSSPSPTRPRHHSLTAVATAQIGLTIALAIAVVLLTVSNTHLTGSIHTEEISNCQAANVNRHQDQQIYNAFLGLPAIAHPQYITAVSRAAQVTAVARLHDQIATAYAPRNCQRVYEP
jgi:hypothetical protein